MVGSVWSKNRYKPVNRPVEVQKPANFKLLKTPLMCIYSEPPRLQEHDGRVGLVQKPVQTGKPVVRSPKTGKFQTLRLESFNQSARSAQKAPIKTREARGKPLSNREKRVESTNQSARSAYKAPMKATEARGKPNRGARKKYYLNKNNIFKN